MIKDVYYSYLNPESIISLANQSLEIITTNHPKAEIFEKAIKNLKDSILKAEQAVGKTAKESLTDSVFRADTHRDATFIGFRNHIDAGLRRHRNPLYQEACAQISAIIDKHGRDVYKLPYAEQSTAFHAMLTELTSADVKPSLANASATGWVNELEMDQKDFDTVFLQRNVEKAADTSITDKEAIKLLKPELKNFYTLINAFYINGQTEFETSINEINSTIDRIITSAKR